MNRPAPFGCSALVAARLRRALIAALLLGLALLGLGIRRDVLAAQSPPGGRPLPFTLESALQYRLIKKIYLGQTPPTRDPGIQYPEGLRWREADTVGAEYVYAALSRLFPAQITLTERIRWLQAAWFSLGVAALAIWLRRQTGRWLAGAVGGFIYAVSIASVIRSTGQEISHENFALPLWLAHLAALPDGRPWGGGRPQARRWDLLAALLFAAALMTWDVMQLWVGCWFVGCWWRDARGCGNIPTPRAARYGAGALILAGVFNPYLRSHGFLLAPTCWPMWAWLAGRAMGRRRAGGFSPRAALIAGIAVALIALAGGAVRDSYGHFGGLLWAKIRFLNHKPADPARLTFAQRIMWTPALHSADLRTVFTLFPYLLWLTIPAVCLLWRKSCGVKRQPESPRGWIYLHIAACVSFILFVRFHVFLAVTSAALLGWWSDALICRARSPWRWAGVALLIGGMLGETAWTRDRPERWGRTNLRYPEYEELCAWMAEHARGEPTLANFGLSGGLAAYADVPVILHPKFEDATIRRRVEEYGRRLFRGTEAELRDWAEPYGARRLVYARGEFAEARPEYQMRYMVDALRPPNDAAARGLEFRPRELNFFVPLWENRKYRVFRVVTRADEATAAGLETAAQQALARGETARAEELAWKSLAIQPRRAVARRTALHAAALRRQGVRDATHPTP